MTARLFVAACLAAWSASSMAQYEVEVRPALEVEVGDAGLRQVISYGVRMLAPGGGDVRVFGKTPRLVAPDGTSSIPNDKPTLATSTPMRFARSYPCGIVDCRYRR